MEAAKQTGLGAFCCKFYCVLISFGVRLQDLLLLGMRLYFGYRFFRTGLGKFQNFENTVGFFQKLGIPIPELNVYMAAGTEMIGGLLLLFGLASRLISIPLAFTMIVAYATAHNEALINIFSDPKAFTEQAPFLFLLTTLLVLAFGPGRFSVDGLMLKKCKGTAHGGSASCCPMRGKSSGE